MLKFIKILAVCSLLAVLGACSAPVLNALAPKPSVEVAAQVGKENTQNKSVIGTTLDNKQVSSQEFKVDQSKAKVAKSTSISAAETKLQSADWSAQNITVYQNNQQTIGIIYLLLLVLGWVLPDPISLYKGIKATLRARRD